MSNNTDTSGAGSPRRRVPLQSAAEGEARLDAVCSELMEMAAEGIMTRSRVAEIMGWSACDVRAADAYHNSLSVAEYAKKVGRTRQHIITLINDGKIRGAFKVPTQGERFEFRIPKETP